VKNNPEKPISTLSTEVSSPDQFSASKKPYEPFYPKSCENFVGARQLVRASG